VKSANSMGETAHVCAPQVLRGGKTADFKIGARRETWYSSDWHVRGVLCGPAAYALIGMMWSCSNVFSQVQVFLDDRRKLARG